MLRLHDQEIHDQLLAKGVDPEHIKSLHVQLQTGQLAKNSFVIPNERLALPTSADVVPYSNKYTELGISALQTDALVLFWLNGGSATRYGADKFIDQPKGVTPVVDDYSYIELKIRNLIETTSRYQLPHHPHVIFMNSFVTDEQTRHHLNVLFKKYPSLDPTRFHFIVQQARIPRFTRAADLKEIDVFVDTANRLSWAPCGHGDFIDLLRDYWQHSPLPNAKYLFFANIDNLAATIDPALFGMHIQAQVGRTVELIDKQPTDQGGLPCKVDGQMLIVEQMKFPSDFPYQKIPWLNTNTFWFTLAELLNYTGDLPWVIAEKTIAEGEVIQLERFACDVNVSSQFVTVQRLNRFWPVKYYADLLGYQKQPEFKKLLQDRYALEK